MRGEDHQQGMGQEGTNGYGSGSGGTGGCDENSIETQNRLPASGGSAAGSAGSGSEGDKTRSGSNNQPERHGSPRPADSGSDCEKTQSESNTNNREAASGETVDEGDKNSSQKNSTTEQGAAPGSDSAETEEKNTSEPNQSSVGPDDNTDEQLKSTAGIHTPGSSNRASGKSFANLQRYKKCPKCGQVYGNKMGGKSGGSQCIRMLPVYDKNGQTICGADGQELMQRCPYIFVSVKQSKLLKKDTREKKPILMTNTLGDAHRIQKVRQIKQTFYGVIVGKLEKELQREEVHGDFYIAAVVPTSSLDSENTDFQRVAVAESGTPADRDVCAVLLRHYTGGMADLIDNQMTEGGLDMQLKEAATAMAFDRFREAQALQSGLGSGSGGDTTMSDANEDELMDFMRTINLPQHYNSVQKVAVDFRSLLERCVGNASDALAPQDLVKINIPMGAACKIVMRAREAAKARR